ncbi:antigen WC1.1-like [Chamaea fasciata]|uniref:antigen WC1.1-like n=1 Tax=Chamaea fasciata TaxID=190680 RepID=UPI00336A5C01
MGPLAALGLLVCVQLCAGSGELRLVDGGGRCAGRVEVKHDGEWGSVCVFDYDWEAHWATVVCRQLGCGRVAKASPHAPVRQGSGRIWLQPVFCSGSEDELQKCLHYGWGQHFCGHERDVGVTCTDAVELRLAGGGSPCAGRVEVKLQGHWGSVGDNNWDMEDAEVVCQQLGCGSASGAYSARERFGAGHGPVSLVLVDCGGYEATLWDCEIRSWGPYNGSIHDADTAVVCQGFSRLVGGDGACAGQLEVRQGRAWFGVCEDQVDMKVAQVVCRELGCGAALGIAGSGRFAAGSGSLWDGGFQCNGTEPLLSACARRPPHSRGCSGPGGVICSPYTGFRLGNSSSGCTGRVEAAVRGTWGSVCATEWDLADAHVLCRHLGCGRSLSVPPGGSFGSGEGPLRPDAFGCSGSERHPGECPVAVLGQPPCAPGNAAAVNCSGAGFATSLRLVDGQSLCDGRLEETITSPAWRRVPLEKWNLWDVHMICAVLGCGIPKDIYTALGSATALSSRHGEVDMMTEELDNISGMGSALTSSAEEMDEKLEEMEDVSEMGPATNSNIEEMVIVCSGSRRVRLVGSSGHCAGRVEVYSGGSWSSVCQEGWDVQDAAVVCRELGCGRALEAPSSGRFGAGRGPLWPYIPDCAGSEESLWECGRSEKRQCVRGGGAGAVCSEHLSVRLAGEGGRCRGFLEVSHNGTWGRVCAAGTSPGTGAAVCRQLGCGDRGQLSARPTQQASRAWLDWVGCEDGARSLWACPSAPWHLQSCDSDGDAYVACGDDSDDITETGTTPYPEGASSTVSEYVPKGLPSRTSVAVAVGTVPVPIVLCVVLGTLLCLSLGALAVLLCRAQCQGPGRAVDAISNAVYEELDYTAMPEYQEVPSHPGSLSEGSLQKLPYYSGDSVEGSDTEAAPDPPARPEQGTPDGYDDVLDVPQEAPAASSGDIFEGVSGHRWICVLPTGGICSPPGPPGAARDPSEHPPAHTDYDDVGSSTVGTFPQGMLGMEGTMAGPSAQAPQPPGGMPELLAELQDAVGSQLVVTQVQAGAPMHRLRFGLRDCVCPRSRCGLCPHKVDLQMETPATVLMGNLVWTGLPWCCCLQWLGWRRDAARPRWVGAGGMGPLAALGLLVCVQLCAGSGELRLVDGGGRCAGRVEVKHDGEWGSVCVFDYDWEAPLATVVCRQPGCGRVAKASPYAPVRQGTGRIWLQPVFCSGSEDELQKCLHYGWGEHFCGHERDVGVTCTDAVELRLAGGGSPCAGRVEVKLQGHWGSVGDDSWDMEDAEVVCQQPGCGSASGAYSARERFGARDGPVSLVLVDCGGYEATLWDCEIRSWGPYNGNIHDADTAVVCQGFSRLVGGDGACAGQLEVRQGRAWFGVCEDQVDMKVAQVVCRELGCGAALGIAGSGRFAAGSGSLWDGGFQCNGTEPLLSACARRPPHSRGCSGPGGVICSPYTGFRLGNSSSGCTGRVEAAVRGTWGSVCATEWDLADAHVLCRHLGCGRSLSVPPGGSFGSGEGPLRPDAFGCSGSERHPGECPVAVLGQPPCAPGNAAAVNCSGIVESLRLVEGETRCDGFLELAIDSGVWRRVPGEVLIIQNFSNVCWELDCGGLDNSHVVRGTTYLEYINETEKAIIDRVIKRIEGMTTDLPEKSNYPFWYDNSDMTTAPAEFPHGASLVCSGGCPEKGRRCRCPRHPGQPGPSMPTGSRRVRLVGSSGHCAGRVEVYSGGSWSSVCQEGWDVQDAAVVCRELGCGRALEAPSSGRFGAGRGPLWPYIPDCAGSEESLWECGRSEKRQCVRGGGAGAVCSEHLSVRLAGEGGRCRGFLEVSHNGTWGRVCANGTSPGTGAAVCRQLGCGDRGQLSARPTQQASRAWLDWVGCEDGARSLWACPSAPWHLQSCDSDGDAHVACEDDSDDITETGTTPYPEGASSTGLPSRTSVAVAVGTVPVPIVLCVVLGTLLCLSLGALTVLLCRAQCQGPGRAVDAISNAVYEELDYTAMPEYQEVPSHPGFLSEGSLQKLPYYSGDSVEGSDTEAAPDPPARPEQGTPHGYDDVLDVPQEAPAASSGDIFEGVSGHRWICVLPTGGICSPPGPPGAARDPSEHPLAHMDYDDVGSIALGTFPMRMIWPCGIPGDMCVAVSWGPVPRKWWPCPQRSPLPVQCCRKAPPV